MSNYYVQPVCSPTRSCILTGRHVIHSGIYDPDCGPGECFEQKTAEKHKNIHKVIRKLRLEFCFCIVLVTVFMFVIIKDQIPRARKPDDLMSDWWQK